MSEVVSKVFGNIILKKVSDGSVVETIPVSGSAVAVSGTVVTISLTNPLSSATNYCISADSGTFVDGAGNSFAGILCSAWTFTTVDNVPPVISAVTSTTTYTSATVMFTTNELAQTTIDWGTTTSYGLGTAGEVVASTNHTMGIPGLATSTLYYFRLTAVDTSGNISIPYTGNFTTRTPPPPPDTTPPANPSGFTGNPGLTSIALSWTNPTDIDFSAVRVMRRTDTYPVNPTDGILVYDGSGTSVSSSGLATSTRYYYTVFARDASLNYSSGAIYSGVTDTPPPTCIPPQVLQGGVCVTPPPTCIPPQVLQGGVCVTPPPTCVPPQVLQGGVCVTPPPTCTPPQVLQGGVCVTPVTPPGGGTGDTGGGSTPPPVTPPEATSTPPIVITPPITSTSTGPFVDFTGTGTPSVLAAYLTLSDVIFTQLGDTEERLVPKNGVIRVDGEKNVRVSIPLEKLPKSLLTIAISIEDPKDAKSSQSYLLRENTAKTAYEAVLPVYTSEGKRPFAIVILDHERSSATRLLGYFDVFIRTKLSDILPPAFAESVTQVVNAVEAPVRNVSQVSTPVGVAVGASQVVLLSTNVTSFYDLYLLLLKLIGLLTGVFRRKKHEPWGVVYDSVTKRPLDPAYVLANAPGVTQSKGEAITDLDGRYGFFLNPGEYIIVANKTHYKFPSDKLKGKSHDELYDNLYFGDPFQVREGGVVQYNIPLDPIEFDWNEFAKNQDKVFKVYSKRTNLRLWFFNIVFFIGMIFSIFSLFVSFSTLNVIVVIVYVSILGFQVVWRATHKITYIKNKSTGKPFPFALVKVWLPGLNTVMKKTVADEHGRFYFLVPPGNYFITVEEKLPDGTYKEVLRTEPRDLPGGVLKEDILV